MHLIHRPRRYPMMKSHLFTVSAFVLAASLLAGNAALAAGAQAARDTSLYPAYKDGDWDEPRPLFDAARDRMASSLASAEPNHRTVTPRARTPVKDGDWDEVPSRVDGSWTPAFE
jgi:hypothetical protein